MLVAALLFAVMGAGVKMASDADATLAQVITLRGLPSVLLIVVWARANGLSVRPNHWRMHVWRNVAGATAMWGGFYGISHLPLATAITLNYTTPLFVAGWMLGWGGAQRDNLRLLAVVLGFIGVLAVLRPTLNAEQWVAALAGLSAGGLGAVAQLQIRSLGRAGEPAWRIVLYFSLFTTASGVAVLLVQGWPTLSGDGWFALAVLALSGLGGQLAMTRAYGAGSALLSAALQYTIIIFASLLGFILWGDRPDLTAALGMAVIVAASLLSVWATARRGKRE